MKKNNVKDAADTMVVDAAEDLDNAEDLKDEETLDNVENLEDEETLDDAEDLEDEEDLKDAEDLEDEEDLEDTDDLEDEEDLEYLRTMEALIREIENMDESDDLEDEEDLEDEDGWGNLEDWVDREGTEDWEELKGLDEIEDPEELARRKAALNARLDKEFEERMQKAFTEIVDEEYANRPKKFPKAQFSEDFERRMNELLYAEPEPEKKTFGLSSLLSLFRPVRSRRAIVVVAALMMLLVGTTAGGANPIIIWLHNSWMEQHGDYVEIEKRGDATDVPKETLQKYELTELPEGYKLKNEEFFEKIGIYFMTYVDEDDNVFVFQQCKKENRNLGNLTANRKDIEKVTVNGLEGYYVKDSDAENLVLSDGEYMLAFGGNLSKEQFIALAEGLQVIE